MTEKSIHKKTVFDVSSEDLWAKWTTHEGLLTFFGAGNKIELEIGGAFEIYFSMSEPYGNRGSEGCKILSFLPQKMLSFSWNAPPQFEAIRNGGQYTWVVLSFEEKGKNSTHLSLDHLGWPEGEDWDAVYDYFDKAWDMVFEWLAKSVEA